MKFEELREQYETFIYKGYNIEKTEQSYNITYNFNIENLETFNPKWSFPYSKEIDPKILDILVFHLGMVELISYWKSVCPKEIKINCGYLSNAQINFYNKLYFHGLGEFLYLNNIDITEEELLTINPSNIKEEILIDNNTYDNILIPIGGGKDSATSLEILKNEKFYTFVINNNQTTKNVIDLCTNKLGSIETKRTLDKKLLDLNAKGYLNGHTPFSAMSAYSSVISAYLNGIKYITFSNENSANESTVKDSTVNHQYSKTIEFENDFRNNLKTIIDTDIEYLSLLRPLSEIQITSIFSKAKQYHEAFKSCNKGSKEGIWCTNCSKCLFVYIMLLPYLTSEELINIFGEDLLNKESLEIYFKELCGISENKPFECVGTRSEVVASLKYYIENNNSLLTDKYKDYLNNQPISIKELLNDYNEEHNVNEYFEKLIKENLYESTRNFK